MHAHTRKKNEKVFCTIGHKPNLRVYEKNEKIMILHSLDSLQFKLSNYSD